MKALLLAGGFGTRLQPYTDALPKPLFPLGDTPVLEGLIRQLIRAGCSAIAVNTHHLHGQIESHIAENHYPIPVITRFEPEILGTGGAVKNLADFWDATPFFIVNADIVTDIDFAAVYADHRRRSDPATLAVHDYPKFNRVQVDSAGAIQAFSPADPEAATTNVSLLAFTGIHVVDPIVLDYIPENRFYSIIDAYRAMTAAGHRIRAYIATGCRWSDIGTPAAYRDAVIEETAEIAFQRAHPKGSFADGTIELLAGDGSDRRWFRLSSGKNSLILADHGITGQSDTPVESDGQAAKELSAFIHIGTHLRKKGLPVPRIYFTHRFCGLVYLSDLGNVHLADKALPAIKRGEMEPVEKWYRKAIDLLVDFSVNGAGGFLESWTCQTAAYDKALVLDRECRYFIESFVNGYMKADVSFWPLAPEFETIAERAASGGISGLMHRDYQSRNLMVQDDRLYIIDFQGARIGPFQYDLASLLIDPYVGLPERTTESLVEYAFRKISAMHPVSRPSFRLGYETAALARNLQILGAFGYLSTVKRKRQFEAYIPLALKTLNRRLTSASGNDYPRLRKMVSRLSSAFPVGFGPFGCRYGRFGGRDPG